MVTGDHSNGPTAIDELLWLPNTITCLKESLTSRGLSKVRPSGLGSAGAISVVAEPTIQHGQPRWQYTHAPSWPSAHPPMSYINPTSLVASEVRICRPFHTNKHLTYPRPLYLALAPQAVWQFHSLMPYNQINSITECIYEQNSKYNDKTNKNMSRL